MKKRTAAFFIAASMLTAACALSACGFLELGRPDDNYPYDAAVERGYEGSEAEWLAQETSVSVYRRMWQEAVADGSFTGDYFTFLKQLGIGDSSADLQRSLLSAVSIVAYNSSASASAGSGVILSLDGGTGDLDILTNYHVVYSEKAQKICNTIEVYLYGGEISTSKLTASFEGGSAAEDVAILHVDGSGTVTAEGKTRSYKDIVLGSAAQEAQIGDSDSLLVGDRVYAVGNAEAWGISVVEGVISVDAEYITMDAIDGSGDVDMLELRTDAVVNHGNSGGGLFNAAGELVGIVNARSEADGVEGIGYAIPVNHVLAVAENITANGGKLKQARLGITVATEESRSVYDPVSGRAFISEKVVTKSVTQGGAAYEAGMDVGDTIISLTLGGKTVQVTRRFKISDVLLSVRGGDTLIVTVSRGDELLDLTVKYDSESYFET